MAECRGCHAQIVWVKTAGDKNTPQNPDGSPHWATCPAVSQFRKAKKGAAK